MGLVLVFMVDDVIIIFFKVIDLWFLISLDGVGLDVMYVGINGLYLYI